MHRCGKVGVSPTSDLWDKIGSAGHGWTYCKPLETLAQSVYVMQEGLVVIITSPKCMPSWPRQAPSYIYTKILPKGLECE